MEQQTLVQNPTIELQNTTARQQQSIKIDDDFPITVSQLQDLFQSEEKDINEKLTKMGGISSLIEQLQTNIKTGVDTNNQQLLNKRIAKFGKNAPAKKSSKSIFTLILEQFEDLMLKILVIAAVVSVIVGVIKDGWSEGWMDGVSIFIAVVLIVSVTASNNYIKEKQFQKLSDKLEQRDVKVVRNGKDQQISIYELLVGDIMYIQVGEIFPVDGILISGNEVTLDLSSETGESNLIKKVPALEIEKNSSLIKKKENSILVSGGKMTEGQGLMLVCTVGKNTQQGKIRETLEVEKEDTPLQKKLEVVANQIGQLGLYTAITTFIILIVHLIYQIIMREIRVAQNFTFVLKYLVNAITIGVAIVVVAVPEGLPLSVTIAYAYSVGKMKDENNLVRDLASCEIMGGANNICSDKTGTLTENKMKVTQLFIEQVVKPENKIISQEIQPDTIKLFCETICQNSTADIEWDDQINDYKQLGSKTECGLLQACMSLGHNYLHIRNTNTQVKAIPFSSDRKRMSTIYKLEDGGYRVATKGAAEIVLERCSTIINQVGQTVTLTEDIKKSIYNEVITGFATQTLRTITIAYKDLDSSTDLEKMDHDFFENGLTLIAIAGIKDKLRSGVDLAVKQCQDAKITVRMVTGDNIITAEAIAKECGILDKNYRKSINEEDYTVMEGEKFRQLVGEIIYKTTIKTDGDVEKQIKKLNGVQNLQKFDQIQKQLRVLARAKPLDKLTLVAGLIKLKQIVAATGDGSNDAPALKNADIGFAMGIQGTEIAKQAAGIILLDDNFCSIVTACKWGRNVYDSVRKFIQFQLTVNIVALFMAVLGATIIKESPLNSVQMLWVNLIMDTFASLALATEKPNDDLLKRPPYKREESMVNNTMWKTIVMQAVYQIIVLIVILFEGPTLFSVASSFDNDPFTIEKGIHFTLFFQIFVFMQIFNEINCRKLQDSQKNVFAGFFNNPLFLFIFVLTIIVQMIFVEFGKGYIKCSPLNWQQNLVCLAIAAGGLVWGFFVKLIPDTFFGKINYFGVKQQAAQDLLVSQRQKLLTDEIEQPEEVEMADDLDKGVTSLLRSRYKKRISRANSVLQKERKNVQRSTFIQNQN